MFVINNKNKDFISFVSVHKLKDNINIQSSKVIQLPMLICFKVVFSQNSIPLIKAQAGTVYITWDLLHKILQALF